MYEAIKIRKNLGYLRHEWVGRMGSITLRVHSPVHFSSWLKNDA
jgi:hypothetical protein